MWSSGMVTILWKKTHLYEIRPVDRNTHLALVNNSGKGRRGMGEGGGTAHKAYIKLLQNKTTNKPQTDQHTSTTHDYY